MRFSKSHLLHLLLQRGDAQCLNNMVLIHAIVATSDGFGLLTYVRRFLNLGRAGKYGNSMDFWCSVMLSYNMLFLRSYME